MESLTPEDMLTYIRIVRELKELTSGSIPNPWIPLISAIAGAAIATIPIGIGAILRNRNLRISVENALLTEIANIVSIIRKRDFLNQLKNTRSNVIKINNQILSNHNDNQTPPALAGITFEVTVSENYFKIYNANLDKIGIIDKNKSIKIVNFYSLIESIMLDVRPTGVLGSIGHVEHYDEVIMFLEDALKLADELSPQTT
ncbi:hypothetical protein [Pseudomonas sp. BF-B-28]|uniref:hypothetical protein n=1 Tax=Pseudomonas sp. BF-B-28 TaxID=2832353 RepID=UPI001CC06ADE|nr:hypothetical protein [Pseudomonas sp. BF-B-28]